MKPRLFNLAAAVSAFVFVLCLLLLARSRFGQDLFYRIKVDPDVPSTHYTYAVRCGRGRIVAVYSWVNSSTPPTPAFATLTRSGWQHSTIDPQVDVPEIFGFALFNWRTRMISPYRGPSGGKEYVIGVRLWPMALLSSILPAIAVHSTLRRRRERQLGRCSNCGYDLRATPDRCPECGTSVAAKPAEAAA